MNRFYYDLHIHSCLSPCGDDISTPDSIAGMGELNGLDIMALTDHNSLKNCPAFFEAAGRHGIIPIAGAEITTAEDIHLLCLFETLGQAEEFDSEVEKRRILVENKSKIFGNQLIIGQNDEVIGTEPYLLINATTLSLEETFSLCENNGGVCYPAHIDRESNGIIAVLGAFPKSPAFRFAELYDGTRATEYLKLTGLDLKRFITSSDAHYLWDIKEKSDYFELDCDRDDAAGVRKKLFELLRDEA